MGNKTYYKDYCSGTLLGKELKCVTAADMKALNSIEGTPECAKDCPKSMTCKNLDKCGTGCNETVKKAGWLSVLMDGNADCACKDPTKPAGTAAANFGVNLRPSKLMACLSMLTALLVIAAQ